jgi:hypothetical protein
MSETDNDEGFDEFDDEEDWEDVPDEQFERVRTILGTRNISVTNKLLGKYHAYLLQHLSLPCEVTGIEDFSWEEYYVWGPGSEKEYEELKKTRPSYTDIFKLIGLDDEFDNFYGLVANVARLSDNKKFDIPLWDLEATDETSSTYNLLDDYAVWFTNYR